MPVTDSIRHYLYEDNFPSFLRDTFIEYRIQHWQFIFCFFVFVFIFLCNSALLCHYSTTVWTSYHFFFTWCNGFSSDCFQAFRFIFVFWGFHYYVLQYGFVSIYSSWCLCVNDALIFFYQVWKIPTIVLLNMFFCLTFSMIS